MIKSFVPWRTPEQFRKVYDYIFTKDITKKRWAVEQLAVWETRCWPTLPAAIEATLLLVRCEIQDMLFEADKSLCQARDVEMMYSTAIVRFVNLILDVEPDKNKSLSVRAELKNLPSWIVAVRNDVAHGQCPNLPVLRMACKACMDHLSAVFWAPEASRISMMKRSIPEDRYVEIIQEYRAVRHGLESYKHMADQEKDHALKSVYRRIDKLLERPLFKRQFLQVLVHPDNFITEKELKLLEEAKSSEKNDQEKFNITAELLNFWKPLVLKINKYDSISYFLELLLLSQEHRKLKALQKVVDDFVIAMLDCVTGKDEKRRDMFAERKPLINYHALLFACLKGASTYSTVVYDKVSSVLCMGAWKDELVQMLGIRQGIAVERERESIKMGKKPQKRRFDITFTVEDLDADLHSELSKRNPKMCNNHWSSAPVHIDFSKYELGYVFNPVEKEKEEPKLDEEQVTPTIEKKPVIPELIEEETMEIEETKLTNFLFERVPAISSVLYKKIQKH